MVRSKGRYQKQRDEIASRKEELYSTLGRVVSKGFSEVGGKEKFLSYLGDVSKEMSGLERRYGSLKLGKDSYEEAKMIIAQIKDIEKAADEPAWIKIIKGAMRYEKMKEK